MGKKSYNTWDSLSRIRQFFKSCKFHFSISVSDKNQIYNYVDLITALENMIQHNNSTLEWIAQWNTKTEFRFLFFQYKLNHMRNKSKYVKMQNVNLTYFFWIK